MISMTPPVFAAISADASLRASSRPRKRNKTAQSCSVKAALSCVVAFFLFAIPGLAQQSLLTRHVREAVLNGQSKPVGDLPATQIMQLDIVLPLSDQAGLDSFLKELYDPASPSYRHFLTVAEFTARFGPSQADYDAVVAFANANGFTVVGGTRDGMEVQIKGPVSAIEAAFHVNMRIYRHPTENRTFFAPDREPTANLPFRLWHISGLDNYSIPHPMLVSKSDFAAAHGIAPEDVVTHATTGSGPSASFLGSDMRAAYYGGGPLTGAGQNLGLWEYLGTDLTDLNTYFTNVGQINNVPVTLLSVDGTSTSCVYSSAAGYCDDTEQTIDMTQAIGMAPGLASLTMYVGAGASGTTGADDTGILAAMTTHNPLPTTIGCSWGWAPADPSTADPYFERMAAQGQNFFAASGDSATWSSSIVVWPADDANVVSVGGTDLVTAGAGGPWASETAWVDSGGGISPNSIAIPAWQQLPGVINSSNQGSTTLRNGPDVSANANWSFYVCGDQTACTTNHWGGTSFAAPMWAGYIALVNQQLAANGESSIGFLNPTIYAQNVTSDYAADFHDITSGTSGSYSAVPGYDLVTGWGSPNGQNLIDALGGAPVPGFTLSISPASLSINRGASGTATITVNDWNGFAGSVNLAASGLPGGVTASFSPNPATGTSALTLSASNAASIGTFNVTLTGASGSLTASTVLSLVVVGSIQITAPPPVNFGAVNIGTTSRAITLVFTVDTAGVFGSKAVFTQGATGRDFADAGTGTCAPNTAYSEGQTCTVNVTFTPQFAGTRYGALVLNDTNGYVISTVYLQGAGAGPQIAFQPGAQSTLGSGFRGPTSVTVDGSGNLYVSDSGSSVLYEMLAVNGTVPASPAIKTIGSGFGELIFVTIDGSGNLYVADAYNNAVKEVVAVNGSIPASPTIITLGSGFEAPDGVAVDGSGNVYVADMGNNAIKEIVAVDGSIPASPTIRALGSGFFVPTGVAVDGSGNVYVSNHATGAIREILAVNGSIPASPTIETLGSGFSDPWGVTVDGSGNVYVADYGNSAVKEILAVNGSIPASPTIRTLGSGFNYPIGVAVDGSDNVFVADTGNSHVVKLDLADPPSLSFANTVVGSTSTDSPQTVTVANVGNAALSFPIPVSGNNPLVSANFTLNSSGASACPLINSGSSTAGTLAAGASCLLPISFAPTAVGALSGYVALGDTNLNAAAPGYSVQLISLSGTGTLPPSFTLGASPASLTVIQGASGTSTITVTGQNGFTGSVTLAASGLPSGVTASFTPNPTTGSSVLTLTASGVASLGTYTVTITGTSGSLTATTTVALTVNPPPSFTLSASPASLSVAPGGYGTSTITVTGLNGFTGSVTLTAPGLPSGVTASFTPNPTTGTSTLTLTASSTAALGPATVAVTGTSGALTETVFLALTVNPVVVNAPGLTNFGAVNIGTTSPVIPLTFTVVNGGTLGSTAVLTQGATGLDFTDAGADTCTANTAYSAGQTCTINVAFTPRFAGARYGAVVLEDNSGNTLAIGDLIGVGVGPQINFLPGVQSALGNGFSGPAGVAVDGSGNIYIADYGSSSVYELLAVNGSIPVSPTVRTLGSGFSQPFDAALDSSGNVYVADTFNNAVKEILAVNGSIPALPTIKTLGSGFSYPTAVAVDGSGNVYVADMNNSAVKEILAVNGSIPALPTIDTLGSGFSHPIGVAVDSSGNVYVSDSGHSAVKEILAVSGSIPTLPTIETLGSGFSDPYGVAVDGIGNVYVADYGNNAVKEILAVNGSIPASPTIETLGSGFSKPSGVVPDGRGNVFVADYENNRVVKLDFIDSPSLSFAAIAVGSTGDPQTVTVENVGNAALTFPIPSSGNNPSIAGNFTLNSSGSLACPLVSASSSTAGTLAAGGSCQLPISFAPATVGALTGSLALTDTNLNALAPAYATQSIALGGTGLASFTLGTSPSTVTMPQGGSGTSNITVTEQDGFTGSVNLTASGLPYGVTASFSPNPTTGASVLTLTASSASSLAKAVTITVTGTSGPLTETTMLLLTVNPANFTLSDSPSTLILNQGSSATAIVTVSDENGFTGSVNLAAPNLPSGVTASFTPNPTTGTSVLTLTASSTAATGTYYTGVSGTSGTEVAMAPNFALTVFPPASISLSAAPAAVTLAPGSSYDSAITVVYQNGFTGSVTLAASGLPSGVTASFTPNPISATGTSVLALTASGAAAPGTYNVTITGTSGTLSATASMALTVNPPTFTIGSSVSSGAFFQGSSLTSTITVMPQPGFTGSVTLAASGLPSGVTASFAPNPTTGTSVLTLTASSTAALVQTFVTITGTSGSETATCTIDIEIVAPSPSFTLGLTPSSLSIPQGASGASTVSVIALNGSNSSVSLTAYSLPSGVTASFSPNPTTGSSVLTLTLSSTAAIGTATVTITGTSGTLNETTFLALTVIPAPGFAPSSENFGSVNIGTTSPLQTLTYTFDNAVTVGSTAVLTQGATGLEFADAGTGTCKASTPYTAGQTCTMNVTFTPRFAGTRYGAVVLDDSNGNVLATGYLQGSGIGPQVNFLPGTESTVTSASSGLSFPYGIAVDGGENLYIADFENNRILKETLSAGAYTQSTIQTSSLNDPEGVAVDGSGNVYVADTGNSRVLKETLSAEGYIETVVASGSIDGFSYPGAVAVDGSGNIYFTTGIAGSLYKETLSLGSYTQSIIPTPGASSNAFGLAGVAVDGSGNVYVVDSGNDQVLKETLSSGVYVQSVLPTSGLVLPYGVSVDANGNVYIVDHYGDQVIKETMSGGSYVQSIVSTSPLDLPLGVAVDGAGNNYISDGSNMRVLKEDFADPPSLAFASTAVGSTSPDSPQTVTVENAGNATLSFPILSMGNNPSIGANFTLNSSGASACPVLIAGSSTAGTLAAGASCQLPISFTPMAATALSGSLVLTDNNLNAAAPGYAVQNISLSGTGMQATPTITWTTPAAITYGTPLSATQLNATASVAGTFAYSPAAGTVLTAGQQTLTATFTPTDTTDYTTATATVTLTVNQATPPITWATPAAITYGTPLSATQLHASSTVSGTFTYSPAAGTVLNAGTQTLTATFAPTDTIDYTTATASVPLTVNKAALTINWATPGAISYGTALSGTQLDATSTASGSYAYSPAAGTVLAVGSHTLSVTFTPTNAGNYTPSTATASVTLTVNKATPAITWATPAAITYGTALSGTQLDASSTAAGSFTYSPVAGAVLTAGSHTLAVTFAPTNTTDYTTASASVTLTVNKATPIITWATPAAITYGTALSGTQLDAAANVPGAFVYSPVAGTVPAVGSDTLTVTFTPTDTSDYTTATGSVLLKVKPAPSFTFGASPASLTVAQGASGKSTITVTGQNGFTGSVTLTASGLPSGVTASFTPNPTTGSSALTLTASSSAAPGTATVTIKGTSGSLTASTTIALTVRCTPTSIVPYISVNGGSTWTEESSATVSSTSTVVDLGPQPTSGGSWSWTGPNKYTSTSRQINDIPLAVGTDLYVATYTNASGCKSTETFTITVK